MQDRLATLLADGSIPPFAIIDGARDRSLSRLLRESGFRHKSLYEGTAAEELVPFGPYLVELSGSASIIERWLTPMWGRSFGVFLVCDQSFDLLRRHLRRFLTVELDGGRKVYFRFYDPRVLRTFLPNCTHDEWMQFFGPVDTYFVESQHSNEVLIFRREADEPEAERLMLTAVN